jgi:hypothetical protein
MSEVGFFSHRWNPDQTQMGFATKGAKGIDMVFKAGPNSYDNIVMP